ncbi:protein kinase domain-containing protein [Nannocystis pusilla]|uniref:protein kinase domain-containing protein n=1 Tax=Nannocystis pusilla TaxID=889268 RepID=UPI003B76A4D0
MARHRGNFQKVGQGLAAAHAEGLIHRDFKPANVLVGRDGRVCVVDFGLVRSSAARTEAEVSISAEVVEPFDEITQAGAFLGTPAYMAPEQFENSVVDASADQFSFCVALFAALYQRRPYSINTREVIRAEAQRASSRSWRAARRCLHSSGGCWSAAFAWPRRSASRRWWPCWLRCREIRGRPGGGWPSRGSGSARSGCRSSRPRTSPASRRRCARGARRSSPRSGATRRARRSTPGSWRAAWPTPRTSGTRCRAPWTRTGAGGRRCTPTRARRRASAASSPTNCCRCGCCAWIAA